MKVGCVKEIKRLEFRVGLTPDNAHEYVGRGHEVFVEKGAGEGSGHGDDEYRAAGAAVLDAAAEVWAASGMVIKVKEPLPGEYPLMRRGQILYAFLHLAADRPLTEALMANGVKAVAYETIRGKGGGLPLLKPMSEVAGRLSVQEGAKTLERPTGGMGLLLGGVPGVRKGRVLILGGGVVGTSACRMAVGLGAEVTVLDASLERLTWLDDRFGSRIQTLHSSRAAIRRCLAEADLVIGAVLVPGAATPKLIGRDDLAVMKRGSVIVDVAVDQGGCCETSRPTYHDAPTFEVDGVVHYCVANMPGAVPMTSTAALTNATLGYGLRIADMGLEAAAAADPGLLSGINVYGGKLACREVGEGFGMEYADPAVLMSGGFQP